jgi:hypothetical protein
MNIEDMLIYIRCTKIRIKVSNFDQKMKRSPDERHYKTAD